MRDESHTSFVLLLVLWLAGLCAAMQFAKIAVTFPSFQQLYSDAGVAVGFLVSLLSFLGVVFGLVTGILVARFGSRNLLLSGLVVGGVISAYQASLPPIPWMLASRLLEGASHLAIVVAAPTLIAQVSSVRHRATAMTLWGTFFGVAFAMTAWFGLPAVARYGLASLFVFHSAAMFVVAGLLFVLLPHSEPSLHTQPLTFRDVARQHFQTYASPSISAPAMGWLFYTLSFVSLLTLLPATLAPAHRAFAIAAMPIASIVSSLTLGVWLLRHISAVQVILIGFAIALLVLFWLALSPGSVIGCVALFSALGLVQGASFAAVPELNADSDARAYANGALAQMGNLGNLSGTPLLLALLTSLGFSGLIVFAVLCYAGGIAVHAALAARRKAVV